MTLQTRGGESTPETSAQHRPHPQLRRPGGPCHPLQSLQGSPTRSGARDGCVWGRPEPLERCRQLGHGGEVSLADAQEELEGSLAPRLRGGLRHTPALGTGHADHTQLQQSGRKSLKLTQHNGASPELMPFLAILRKIKMVRPEFSVNFNQGTTGKRLKHYFKMYF